MSIKLNGSTAGSVALDAPASTDSSADLTFTLPVNTGTSGQALTTNGSGALSFATVASPYAFSYWRLDSNFQNDSETRDTIDTWAESNAPSYVSLGSKPTYSSGTFTFPSTGYWRIQANLIYYLTTATGDSFSLALDKSTDSGSSYTQFATTGGRLDGSLPANVKLTWIIMNTLKVENASTTRMQVVTAGTKASTGHFMGSSQADGQEGQCSTMLIEKMANL